PYVLVSQPSLFDESRAPKGKHTLWAYCHVPNGSSWDMTDVIEDQIERFAPGFKDTIISKNTMNAPQFQSYNANYIGGDINGGAQFFKQLFGRPVLKWDPYHIPGTSMYICSSSTPPGGGVHGMCGYHSAESVLKNEFRISSDKN
ncbi:MAG TPA: FAD-dependent oxidoreductase, partial [Balneolaceae bacterium]|nr:FAD-dependent oxidoreductase [Balneolaceae bacterium]